MSIIAHRGFNDTYPENSIMAFRESIRKGCTFLEVDIQETKDNIYVLFHDNMICNQKIRELTYRELNQIVKTDTFDHLLNLIRLNLTHLKIILDLKFTTYDELFRFIEKCQKYPKIDANLILQVCTGLVIQLDQLLTSLEIRSNFNISWLPTEDNDVKIYTNVYEHCDIIMQNYKYFLNHYTDFIYKHKIYVYTVNNGSIIKNLRKYSQITGIVTDQSKYLNL